MFIPSSFRVEDRETLADFMEQYGFATLITVHNGVPFASHVPLLLDRTANVLLGHLARANPQWQSFEADTEALAIFAGPHAYISPSWYATAPAVPTWNYTTVHVYGTPRLLSDERTREVVDATVQKYESKRETPWPNDGPEDYRHKLLAGIVGFEIAISRIEGKFKLGQNRSVADQTGMLAGLRADGTAGEELANFIATYHQRRDSGSE